MKWTTDKDLNKMLARASEQGCSIIYTRGSHVRVTRDNALVIVPSSPSDHREVLNTRSRLRRILGVAL